MSNVKAGIKAFSALKNKKGGNDASATPSPMFNMNPAEGAPGRMPTNQNAVNAIATDGGMSTPGLYPNINAGYQPKNLGAAQSAMAGNVPPEYRKMRRSGFGISKLLQ